MAKKPLSAEEISRAVDAWKELHSNFDQHKKAVFDCIKRNRGSSEPLAMFAFNKIMPQGLVSIDNSIPTYTTEAEIREICDIILGKPSPRGFYVIT